MSWAPWADLPPSSLLLDFAQLGTAWVRGPGDVTLRPRLLSSFWNFARASSATRVNAAGQIELVGNNVARIDHDPVTLQPRGLLIEGQRTNLLLNSLINGTSLVTQSVTVTAAAHTLSFYGTGTVTVSGTHSATVVGTGAYPARTTLTFTPSAGTLTVTVSGMVQFAQLEVGAFASSFIPTGASQVTRVADSATVTGANFSAWYNQAEGTFFVDTHPSSTTTLQGVFAANDGTADNRIDFRSQGAGFLNATGVQQASYSVAGMVPASSNRVAVAYAVGSLAASRNGGPLSIQAPPLLPINTQFVVGGVNSGDPRLFGTIRRIRYWPTRLTNAQLQTITGPYPVTVLDAASAGSLPLSGSASTVAIAAALASGDLAFSGSAQADVIAAATAQGALPIAGTAAATSIMVASAAGDLPLDGESDAEVFLLPDPLIVFTVEAENRAFAVTR
ncbi:MAG: hypothetical protein MUF47_08865 [Porphyrobacter sp.]|jgi:hypothetical protein|nr:hypothetical protein [Porphyrobacter sp.]